jgi:hypothetical protein
LESAIFLHIVTMDKVTGKIVIASPSTTIMRLLIESLEALLNKIRRSTNFVFLVEVGVRYISKHGDFFSSDGSPSLRIEMNIQVGKGRLVALGIVTKLKHVCWIVVYLMEVEEMAAPKFEIRKANTEMTELRRLRRRERVPEFRAVEGTSLSSEAVVTDQNK